MRKDVARIVIAARNTRANQNASFSEKHGRNCAQSCATAHRGQ
jgi:hypothetical protein